MSRLIVDDVKRKNPLALINTAKLAMIAGLVAPTPQFITATADNQITIAANTVAAVETGGLFFADGDTTIGVESLDTGNAFTYGSDYYVYVCDTQNIEQPERYVISKNSTYPVGWNAANSRKIGGFHYGKNRRVDSAMDPINASGVAYGAGWESNVYDGIVPRSVWTTQHRSKSQPEGMVYMGGGVWVDIYLASDNGNGGLASVYNALPMTGTEGMNWYKFTERALKSGKRLMSYNEFCQAAFGSPQGLADSNDNAWSMATNTGRKETGQVVRAVSAIGVRDYVGNVWKWNLDLITNASGRVLQGSGASGTYTYNDGDRVGQQVTGGTGHGATTRADNAAPVAGAWGWDKVSPFGDGYGNIYEYYDQSLIALLSGGYWGDGVQAGARAVNLSNYPWNVGARIGCVCASESL